MDPTPRPQGRRTQSSSQGRVLAFATLSTWLALLAGMSGLHGWLLDLLADFRVHYAVAFVGLACAALIQRARFLAVAALVGALVSAAPLLRYLEPLQQSAASEATSLRLVSFNIRFRNRELERVASYLEQTQADVIVLQEVTQLQARTLEPLLAGYPHRSVDADWRGAAVYSRWPLTAADWRPLADEASRVAYVQIDWRGARISLLGVHLHWPLTPREARLRDLQLERLAALAAAEVGPLIVAGDLNITPWSPRFRMTLETSGLRDCALGQGLSPSWPSQAIWLGIRIDHCLVSPHWRVLDVSVGPHVGSDHRPVIVELSLERERRATSGEPE